MTWEEYYDGFYEWSFSTQKSYRLSNYGPADEVWEVAEELVLQGEVFATRFLEKAFDAGVRFTPAQVLEMVGTVEEPILSKLAEQTDVPFKRAHLEEIYLMIDDDSFRRISRRAKIDIFDDVGGAYGQVETVSTVRLAMDIATAAGTTGRAINTVASSGATRVTAGSEGQHIGTK